MMMISLKRLLKNWGVVQPAERVAVNHEVAGSSPAAPATKYKGEKMSTIKETKELREEVAKLRNRISQLVDELAVFKNDIDKFKEHVADDVKLLVERINK